MQQQLYNARVFYFVAVVLVFMSVVVDAFLVPSTSSTKGAFRQQQMEDTSRRRIRIGADNDAFACRTRASSLLVRHSAVQDRVTTAAAPPTEECRVVLEDDETLLPPSFFQSLPWSRSITGEGKDSLLYMPFVEEQMRHLQSLGGAVKDLPVPPSVRYQRAEKKAAHMASFCVETEDFRKVRFTYMDGGACVQVFNSVWYPRYDTDAPILGVDLLLFGGHRMLAVVDYQPLSKDAEYSDKYLDHLVPVKAKYPALAETISNRYYEDTRWFSDQMLFGRLEDPAQVLTTLMPAFQEYLSRYTKIVQESRRDGAAVVDSAYVQARHKDYDEYNLIRDPAGKLFEAYFGKPFAHDMLGFLFDLADPSILEEVVVQPPHQQPQPQ